MKTYEVFLKKAGRDEFRHAGSLDAPDPEMAVMYARETHARRAEGAEMWLVERGNELQQSVFGRIDMGAQFGDFGFERLGSGK